VSGVAVVSGGGTGIGRAIAASLASDGFDVVIVGRRATVVAETAKALNAELGIERVSSLSADLSKADDVEALINQLQASHGTIDVIVNNAGATPPPAGNSLAELADSWRAAYDLNVVSAVLLTHGLLPYLRRPGGRIIFIGSMSSRTGGGMPSYGAAKAALNGWVLALSADHAGEGITANVVLPGYVPGTELAGGAVMPPEIHDRIVSRIAAGRPGKPEDTATLVSYLASPQAGFLTGQVIEVNGGNVPSTR
jgi:3-oxoacyl-[acyl-carrier protein] reductase